MATKKITLNELRSIVKQIIKEEAEKPIQKIKIDGEVLSVYLINKPFDSFLYVLDSDGENYIDISTKLVDNPLDNAVWVEIGGQEEKIANILKKLKITNATTKSGYNKYRKYDII
jgi:hypothetical protein